jgi:cellulose 1,4-beta-cellobiosidase
VFPSQFYASEVKTAAAQISDANTAAAALKVASIPSFTWFDQIAKVPQLGWLLGNATAQQTSSGQKQIVQIIVYDLPDRDCAAAASNGEFSYANGGAANYQNYINQLVAQIKCKFFFLTTMQQD